LYFEEKGEAMEYSVCKARFFIMNEMVGVFMLHFYNKYFKNR